MNWNLASFVTSSKLRFRILVEVNRGEKTPSQLATITDDAMSHVSKTLRELENRNLIKCLTPKRRKQKFYQITKKGIKILEFINEQINL